MGAGGATEGKFSAGKPRSGGKVLSQVPGGAGGEAPLLKRLLVSAVSWASSPRCQHTLPPPAGLRAAASCFGVVSLVKPEPRSLGSLKVELKTCF